MRWRVAERRSGEYLISHVENHALESKDTLLKIILVVGGSSRADRVTGGVETKGIPTLKSKSADAGVETLLMMMPMRGWAWHRGEAKLGATRPK